MDSDIEPVEIADTEDSVRRTTPGWFWLVAIAILLFEALGCVSYVLTVTANGASLPIDQRLVADATPVWVTAAYALAVWIGLGGALLLLARKGIAASWLFVSMLFVLIQFGGVLLVPDLRQSMSSNALFVPFVIAVTAYGSWQFAKIARARGWLV